MLTAFTTPLRSIDHLKRTLSRQQAACNEEFHYQAKLLTDFLNDFGINKPDDLLDNFPSRQDPLRAIVKKLQKHYDSLSVEPFSEVTKSINLLLKEIDLILADERFQKKLEELIKDIEKCVKLEVIAFHELYGNLKPSTKFSILSDIDPFNITLRKIILNFYKCVMHSQTTLISVTFAGHELYNLIKLFYNKLEEISESTEDSTSLSSTGVDTTLKIHLAFPHITHACHPDETTPNSQVRLDELIASISKLEISDQSDQPPVEVIARSQNQRKMCIPHYKISALRVDVENTEFPMPPSSPEHPDKEEQIVRREGRDLSTFS